MSAPYVVVCGTDGEVAPGDHAGVLDDASPFVRFLERHARHGRVERQAVLPEGWSIIDGEG